MSESYMNWERVFQSYGSEEHFNADEEILVSRGYSSGGER